MATTKSLKKLRSASTAFLEDGSSFLHGVDGLLRDIQRTIVDLQRREQLLVEREKALESRESRLDGMLQQLAERLTNRAPEDALTIKGTSSLGINPANSGESSNDATTEMTDSNVATELTEILATVDEAVTPIAKPESMKPVAAVANTSMHQQNQRKKRRR